jgi:acyl-CoA thioesterase
MISPWAAGGDAHAITPLIKSPYGHLHRDPLKMTEWGSFLPKEVCERLQRMSDVPMALSMGMRTRSINEDGEVRVTMDAKDKLNAVGFAHGGAVFALADQAFGLASNLGKEPQVALCASINYLKPGKGMLEAVAMKTFETRRTSLYEVRVYDEGELIAVFQGTGYKLNGNGGRTGETSPEGK